MDKPLHVQLREARKAAKLTQPELAERLGYASHADISRIERGQQWLGKGVLEAWMRACGHRLAVIPGSSSGLDALAAALADIPEEQRPVLRRIAEVMPHLPENVLEQLAHDLELWERRYLRAEDARSRA
jgi:transcriptional regulator with XRE-family HTH domain